MPEIRSARFPRLARRLAAAAVTAVLLTLAGPAVTASAATGGTGWLRVAHLSPDTAHVDVSVVALSGSAPKVKLKDVAYGSVSRYLSLPPGTYAIAMTPAGGGTTPVVQKSVQVRSGTASTIAVTGRNSALTTHVFHDDLSTPSTGTARVRLVQAATTVHNVSVTTSTGRVIARSAALGTSTPYTTVPARTWALRLTGDGSTTTSNVALKNGAVVTLFVLDTASKGITVKPVIDSASVGAVPKGFLATGGGFLAHQARAEARAAEVATGLLVAVAGAGAGLVVVARRRRRA